MKRVRVAAADHVWFRSILEAYEGLVTWRVDASGAFELAPAPGREEELSELLDELTREGQLSILTGSKDAEQ